MYVFSIVVDDSVWTHFGLAAIQNKTITLRERDTMDQRIGSIDDVIATVIELIEGTIYWPEACKRLPAYDGVQAVE